MIPRTCTVQFRDGSSSLLEVAAEDEPDEDGLAGYYATLPEGRRIADVKQYALDRLPARSAFALLEPTP